jgi:DNA-binding MarR family transcriptional regulator
MLNYSADEFEKIGLTVPQWRILFALWETGGCRFGTLAGLTSIEPPTLSRLLNLLEAKRLVRRRRNPSDTRSTSISLTAAGKTRFESTLPFARDVTAMYLAGVSKADVNALRRALTQIYDNVVALSGARERCHPERSAKRGVEGQKRGSNARL